MACSVRMRSAGPGAASTFDNRPSLTRSVSGPWSPPVRLASGRCGPHLCCLRHLTGTDRDFAVLELLPHPRVLRMALAAVLAGRSAGMGPLDFQLVACCVFRVALCVLLLRYGVPSAQAIFMACALSASPTRGLCTCPRARKRLLSNMYQRSGLSRMFLRSDVIWDVPASYQCKTLAIDNQPKNLGLRRETRGCPVQFRSWRYLHLASLCTAQCRGMPPQSKCGLCPTAIGGIAPKSHNYVIFAIKG